MTMWTSRLVGCSYHKIIVIIQFWANLFSHFTHLFSLSLCVQFVHIGIVMFICVRILYIKKNSLECKRLFSKYYYDIIFRKYQFFGCFAFNLMLFINDIWITTRTHFGATLSYLYVSINIFCLSGISKIYKRIPLLVLYTLVHLYVWLIIYCLWGNCLKHCITFQETNHRI